MLCIFSRDSVTDSGGALSFHFLSCDKKPGKIISAYRSDRPCRIVSGKSGSVAVLLVTVFLICFIMMPVADFLIARLHTASLMLHVSGKTEQAMSGLFVLADEQALGEARLSIDSYQLNQYLYQQISANLPDYAKEKTFISDIRSDTVTRPDISTHWDDLERADRHWQIVSCELSVEDITGNEHMIRQSVLILLD